MVTRNGPSWPRKQLFLCVALACNAAISAHAGEADDKKAPQLESITVLGQRTPMGQIGEDQVASVVTANDIRRFNRLDQLRLDLLERRTPPEFEGSPAELWEAARAYLAIKWPRHHATTRLLFRAGEQAYLKGDYARAARCFAPFLSNDPPRSGQVRAQHGHCLLMQGQLQEKGLIEAIAG